MSFLFSIYFSSSARNYSFSRDFGDFSLFFSTTPFRFPLLSLSLSLLLSLLLSSLEFPPFIFVRIESVGAEAIWAGALRENVKIYLTFTPRASLYSSHAHTNQRARTCTLYTIAISVTRTFFKRTLWLQHSDRRSVRERIAWSMHVRVCQLKDWTEVDNEP